MRFEVTILLASGCQVFQPTVFLRPSHTKKWEEIQRQHHFLNGVQVLGQRIIHAQNTQNKCIFALKFNQTTALTWHHSTINACKLTTIWAKRWENVTRRTFLPLPLLDFPFTRFGDHHYTNCKFNCNTLSCHLLPCTLSSTCSTRKFTCARIELHFCYLLLLFPSGVGRLGQKKTSKGVNVE